MTPYRDHDSIGSVCIVCYRHAAHGPATCPRCRIEMTPIVDADSAGEIQSGLESRARAFAERPKRMRNALTYGGGAALAIVVFVILVATGIYDPEIHFGLVRGGGAWLWPAFVLYIVFGLILIPIASRVFPPVAPMPSPATIPALARYLGLVVVDETSDTNHKPPGEDHG